jgi:hypothetical protein
MRAIALFLLIGWMPCFAMAQTPGSALECVSVNRDPGNLPLLDLREDGSFRIGATVEDLDRAPLVTGTWAFTSSHLMLVVPAGGCISAPKLGRMVAVFVQHDNGTLYPAMPSTATDAVALGNPQTGCPDYDATEVENYRPAAGPTSAPTGLWQGHRELGTYCTGGVEE